MKKTTKSIIPFKIYLWLFLLTVFFFVLAGFCLYNWYKVFTCSPEVNMKSDENYLTMLIAVAGFLAAFSAISIYSIFNASLDREKERIDELGRDCDELLEKIKNEIKNSSQSYSDFKNQKALFDLTSPYSPPFNKRQAILHFYQTPPETEDTRAFIRNYFQSLGASERGKKYYQELEKLISAWETLKPEEVTAGIEW